MEDDVDDDDDDDDDDANDKEDREEDGAGWEGSILFLFFGLKKSMSSSSSSSAISVSTTGFNFEGDFFEGDFGLTSSVSTSIASSDELLFIGDAALAFAVVLAEGSSSRGSASSPSPISPPPKVPEEELALVGDSLSCFLGLFRGGDLIGSVSIGEPSNGSLSSE
jgi:hypothetical protein